MREKFFYLLVLVFLIAVIPNSAFADLKFKWGPYLRVRHEYWKNNFDMDNDALDNRNFFRIKASIWGQLDFTKDISLYAKLTDEFKAYTYYAPSSSKSTGKTDKAFHFDINEVVFDNLYLDLKNLMGLPLDLRFGRQDLTDYGEGFLIGDGNSGDGSRTAYFNAVKTTWRINDKNNLDFIYFNDPRDDVFLPVINEDKAPQGLTTTKEEGCMLYLKNKAIKDLGLEGYYIYKREGEDGGTGLQGQKGIINTFGSFAKYSFAPYTLRTQLAYQFGSYGANDRNALGGYTFLDREFKDTFWSPKATAGFIYLSGDKRSTSRDEAWDPLFSRYGWMSEIYGNFYKTEAGISGYWTNLQMWRTTLSLNPTQKAKISLIYNFLRANAQVAASSVFSGTGRNRGHMPQLRLDYAFNKNVSAYLLGEYFIPGNFYVDKDAAVFLRTELQIKF